MDINYHNREVESYERRIVETPPHWMDIFRNISDKSIIYMGDNENIFKAQEKQE